MPELWERQPWDTTTSFSRFQRFYLQQEPPRSLDKAWRAFASQKRGVPATKITSRAGRHWRGWYEAKDAYGEPIPGAIGWRQRADAYEQHLAEQRQDKYEQERLQRMDEMRALSTAAFGKLVQAWRKYDPTEDTIKLTELAQAFRVITQELRTAYDLEPAMRHQHDVHVSWQAEVIELLRTGAVTASDVRDVLGDELAADLFKRASQAPAAD